MQARAEIVALVQALEADTPGRPLHLRDEDYARLEALLRQHPELWPTGLADTLEALRRKLRWETVDRGTVPEPLRPFLDEIFRRDLDPMALARAIGADLCGSCAEGGCRC